MFQLPTAAWWIHNDDQYRSPPKRSQKLVMVGLDVLWDTFTAVRSRRYLERLLHLFQLYGNTFSKQTPFSVTLCTIEPDNLKTILSTKFKDYGVTSTRKNAFRPLLGNSVLTAEGTAWAHARATLRPSFSKAHYGDLEVFENHIQDLLSVIRERGPVVDLRTLFLGLTSDITTHSFYGESIDSLRSTTLPRVMQAFEDAQYGCEEKGRWGIFAGLFSQRKFRESVEILHQYVESHLNKIQEHGDMDKSASNNTAGSKYILLDELRKSVHGHSQLINELLTILIAGRDTTASLLCNIFHNILKRPNVWLQLRAEVDRLNGDKPTLEQINQLQYSRACVNESKQQINH